MRHPLYTIDWSRGRVAWLVLRPLGELSVASALEAAAERLQDVVVRDGAGVPRSEVVLHPDPELRQPHGDQGRSIDPERRVGCTLEQVFG